MGLSLLYIAVISKLRRNTIINGKIVSVKIDIKKHRRKINSGCIVLLQQKNVGRFPSDTSRVLKRGYIPTDATESISTTDEDVKGDDKG